MYRGSDPKSGFRSLDITVVNGGKQAGVEQEKPPVTLVYRGLKIGCGGRI